MVEDATTTKAEDTIIEVDTKDVIPLMINNVAAVTVTTVVDIKAKAEEEVVLGDAIKVSVTLPVMIPTSPGLNGMPLLTKNDRTLFALEVNVV